MFRAWERRSQPPPPSPSPPLLLTVPGINADRLADAEPRARTGCSGCGSTLAVDLAASGAGLQSLPSAPARLCAPGPALPAATEAALHPESWAQPGPHPQGPAREPGERLAPPTAFAPPGLACAAAAERPLVESVGCTSHQRESGWSSAPRRAFLKDQYPVLETLGHPAEPSQSCLSSSRSRALKWDITHHLFQTTTQRRSLRSWNSMELDHVVP